MTWKEVLRSQAGFWPRWAEKFSEGQARMWLQLVAECAKESALGKIRDCTPDSIRDKQLTEYYDKLNQRRIREIWDDCGECWSRMQRSIYSRALPEEVQKKLEQEGK